MSQVKVIDATTVSPTAQRFGERSGVVRRSQPVVQLAVNPTVDGCRIAVSGPLDMTGAEWLLAKFRQVAVPGIRVRLDVSAVTFFGTAALHALLEGRRRLSVLGGELVVTGVNVRMRRLMQITGDDRILLMELP